MSAKVYPFSYFVARKDSKRVYRPHQRRDLGAAIELLPALAEMGCAAVLFLPV